MTGLHRVGVAWKPRRRDTSGFVLVLHGRSAGGWCELQLPGLCLGQGSDPAHRRGTKSGGRHGDAVDEHDRPSNALWACRACHRWQNKGGNRATAEQFGWVLREHEDPLTRAVWYRCREWMLLDDRCGVIPCPQ